MPINNFLVDIATEVWESLESPTTISIPAITYHLRSDIGVLNNLLGTSYDIDVTTLEIVPSLGEEEKSILKSIYLVWYYGRQAIAFLGVNGITLTVEVSSDGGTVRRGSKTLQSAQYLQLKRDEQKSLKDLVAAYRLSKSMPLQVVGDDIDFAIPNYYPPRPGRWNDKNI